MYFVFPLLLYLGPVAFAENVKTLKLCEKSVAPISVSTKGTVLEFPTEPEKVVLGSKGAFAIEYIKSDLAISPATPSSRSNLFVYLQGRRFVLDLTASMSSGVSLYFIRDCQEEKIQVKKNGK